MHRSISILVAVAILSAASPAFAQELRSASVKISESDFTTSHGRAALNHRIQVAVEDVCGVNAMAEGESWKDIKICQLQIRQQFDSQIASLRKLDDVRLSAR
jgi:UrcA family protein